MQELTNFISQLKLEISNCVSKYFDNYVAISIEELIISLKLSGEYTSYE